MTSSKKTQLKARVISELYPRRLLPSLTAGLVAGIIIVIVEISFAALIFAGDLSGFVSHGIGLMLFGAVVIGIVVAITSSFPGMVALPQDGPAAIFALIAVAISSSMVAFRPIEIYTTVVVGIAITSLLTGIFFVALGYFKLGGLVRFIPYPVHWRLSGRYGLATGQGRPWRNDGLVRHSFSNATVVSSKRADTLVTKFDLCHRYSSGYNRSGHFFVLPGMLLGAMAIFYLLLWVADMTVAGALSRGCSLAAYRLFRP
ncbi:MAG: SulP family inorganic anion transporter [Chloroflexi bacterium]|nr:SulP family inorganic anion transporter [Chloroflexota bacterium]